MRTTIFCPDMECDSCEKVISKTLNKLKGVNSFSFETNSINLDYNSKKIKKEKIIDAIKEKGYRIYTDPYNRKPFLDRLKDFASDKKKYELERKFFSYVSGTFLVLLLFQALFLYYRDRLVFGQEFLWMTYLTITVVAIGGAIWHFKSYRTHVTSMIGMMIGMTIGMQTGMMLGMVLGATTGFFTGALVSMLVAAAVGAYSGYCCGITGVMEGLMAGSMGGIMGAMTAVMMGANIFWFMPPFMLVNLVVIVGLVYMIFEEVVEDKEAVVKQPPSFWKFLLASALVLLALLVLLNSAFTGDSNYADMVHSVNMQEVNMNEMGVPCHQMGDGTWMGNCDFDEVMGNG